MWSFGQTFIIGLRKIIFSRRKKNCKTFCLILFTKIIAKTALCTCKHKVYCKSTQIMFSGKNVKCSSFEHQQFRREVIQWILKYFFQNQGSGLSNFYWEPQHWHCSFDKTEFWHVFVYFAKPGIFSFHWKYQETRKADVSMCIYADFRIAGHILGDPTLLCSTSWSSKITGKTGFLVIFWLLQPFLPARIIWQNPNQRRAVRRRT